MTIGFGLIDTAGASRMQDANM